MKPPEGGALRRISARAGLFLAIAAIVLVGAGLAVRKQMDRQHGSAGRLPAKMSYYAGARQVYDLIFVGDSRTLTDFHPELIDPETGAARAFEDGAEGELVLTHLVNRAAPLLRFRTRDHVRVSVGRCACGRTAPRVRCIGRTDDMLIVRGVNVFPSAVREVVNEFAPAVSGVLMIRPRMKGVRQEPPLPVAVEVASNADVEGLAERLRARLREKLLVAAEITLVPVGGLPRSEYKSKLVEKA